MRVKVGAGVAAVVVVGALALTGCSSSGGSSGGESSAAPSVSATPNNIADMKADQILEESKAAAVAASSVKVVADIESTTSPTTLDLTFTQSGATGTIGSGEGQFEMITTADSIYIKGDEAFNTTFGGEAAAQLLNGKWLQVPTDSEKAADFLPLASGKSFFESLMDSTSRELTVTDQTKDFGSVPAIGLEDDGQAMLWFATVGEPYPMAIEALGEETGSMTFSDWNAPVTITPPPTDEVVDVSTIPGFS